MGRIKLKIFAMFISIIFFICLFLAINNKLFVKAAEAEISIDAEPTYRLINDIKKNNVTIGKTYEINVTIVNSGLIKSDELTINLTDEEHFSLSNKIIMYPGETKVVSFNWSTLLIKNQQIIISYYPTDPDIDWNKYNSGSKAFTLYITEEKDTKVTTTPGFEIVILIISILIFTFLMKKKK